MTCYSPLTAYPKLKTTITKSVEVDGTPFYPHLRGPASQWTAAAIRDNARLQYRLPADWAVSLGQCTPLKLRVNRCTTPPSLFHENNADAEISTPLPPWYPPSHSFTIWNKPPPSQSAFAILKSLAPAPQLGCLSPHFRPWLFFFFCIFGNSHLVVIRTASISISREGDGRC